MKDDDFQDLAREFRDVDAPSATRLAVAVRRGRWKLAGETVLMVAIVLFLAALAGVKLWRDRDLAALVFALIETVFPVGLLVHVWRAQRSAWRAASETVHGFLQLEIERRRSKLRQGRMLFRVLPWLALACLVFQIIVLWTHPEATHGPAWAFVLGFGGVYAILAGVWLVQRWSQSRHERELVDLERQLSELATSGA